MIIASGPMRIPSGAFLVALLGALHPYDSVERAYAVVRACGTLDGKLMGGAGGGFLMLFCDRERKADVRPAMAREGLREMPFAFEYDEGKVLLNI